MTRPALALLVAVAVCACDERLPEPSGRIAVAVAPLTLTSIIDASWGLAVWNGAGELVWSRAGVTASRYGNGPGGELAYVGTCDAGAPDHRVKLVLEGLWVDTNTNGVHDEADAPATGWVNPCHGPLTDPDAGCVVTATCAPDADTPVRFDVTVQFSAQQGFFDLAVSFDDIFCSAKYDTCYADGRQITQLFDPETGARVPSGVLAIACTAGTDQGANDLDTTLMVGATLQCGSDTVVLAAADLAPGTHDALLPAAGSYLVTSGVEQLAGLNKTYFALALGSSNAPCTLSFAASADGAPWPSGFPEVSGYATWPYIVASIDLTTIDSSGDAQACIREPLEGQGAGFDGIPGNADDGDGIGPEVVSHRGGDPAADGWPRMGVAVASTAGGVATDLASSGPPGPLGMARAVSAAPAQSTCQPGIAYNPDDNEYLIVWHDVRYGFNPEIENFFSIYAQRVGPDGAPIGPEIAVLPYSGDPGYFVSFEDIDRCSFPRVVYNPVRHEYLVTFQTTYTGVVYGWGQRVSRDGQLPDVYFSTGYTSTQMWMALNLPYHRAAVDPTSGTTLLMARGPTLLYEWIGAWAYRGTLELHGALLPATDPFPDPGSTWGKDFSASGWGLFAWPVVAVPDHPFGSYKDTPAVAYDAAAGEFVWAWLDARDYNTSSLFVTRRMGGASGVKGPEQVLGRWGGLLHPMASVNLAVGGAAGEFMVVSSARAKTAGIATIPTLPVVGFVGGVGFSTIDDSADFRGANVVYNPYRHDYLVIWRHAVGDPTALFYRHLGRDGGAVDTRASVTVPEGLATDVSMAFGQGSSVLTWVGGDGGIHAIGLR